MSYIGRSPQIGAYHKLDQITTDGSASYTMQLDSANFVPESVNHLIVSVNGVIQAPTDSFTVSGSTITFASSLSVSDTIDFIMALGNVLDIGVPSDATVSLSKLTASGTKDATTFLRGDNTFATVSSYADSDALSLFNATGSAPVFACRSWVNFNGTGTVAIRDEGNVSSITDNGTGDYSVNYTTAMEDTNYCIVTSSGEDTSGSHSNHISANPHRSTPATTSCRINTSSLNGTAVDHQFVYVAIFR